MPDLSIYETAKAGIEGMTRALARDLGEANIRVNCVVPGAIRTPRQMKLWHTPEEEAKILAQQCLKARVDPVHVTAMVLFLASDDAAHVHCAQLLGGRAATVEAVMSDVECVWPVGAMLGEGPVWSAAEQARLVRRHQGARHSSLPPGERRTALLARAGARRLPPAHRATAG